MKSANSKKKTARRAGLYYLLAAITGSFGIMFLPWKIMVPGDAAATIGNSDDLLAPDRGREQSVEIPRMRRQSRHKLADGLPDCSNGNHDHPADQGKRLYLWVSKQEAGIAIRQATTLLYSLDQRRHLLVDSS